MPKPIRVRFAPSPTGYLHVGGARSALFNYLFARHQRGHFVLRIEDTDRERIVEDSVQQIIDSLSWLGLEVDEGPAMKGEHGPYTQSERLKLYTQYAEELLKKDVLYQDYSSPERLDRLRKEAQAKKQPFKFSREMALDKPETPGDRYVLRLAVQPGDDIGWNDAVWGEQRWQRAVLDDFVAVKSDGYPTYHFASVVDDHSMEISHVIRAAEWIPSTPKHILLYEAFGWERPTFAHLPQVLGPDKAKLSKRHGAKSVLEYRDTGYLPEAMLNYLSSLGFNDGTTREIYSRDELIEAFSLDRVQASPAVFDAERLDWMNGVYIRNLALDELYVRCAGFWPTSAKSHDDIYRKRVLGLVQERLKYLGELPELTEFFFVDPKVDSAVFPKQLDAKQTNALLTATIAELEESDFSQDDLESRLRALGDKHDVKTGQLFGLIRVAVTGKTAAPGLFETLNTLGKATSLRRLKDVAKPS